LEEAVLSLLVVLVVDYVLLLEEVMVVDLRYSVFQDCTACSQGGESLSYLHCFAHRVEAALGG
jgi:hypothetical protein